jgi:Na+/proline symporter
MDAGSPRHFQFWPDANKQEWLSWIGAWLVIGLGSIPSQDVFQRFNSARSERSAVSSMWLGGVLYMLFSLVPLYLSLAALKLGLSADSGSDHGQGLVNSLIRTHMPSWVQIVFYGALLSAILSTASGALLAPAALLSENILSRLRIRGASLDPNLTVLRYSVAAVALISWGMAMWKNNIFLLVSMASALGLAGLFVPMCAALFHGKPSRLGAHTAFISGLATYVSISITNVFLTPAHLAGLFASILGYVLGTFLERNRKLKPRK